VEPEKAEVHRMRELDVGIVVTVFALSIIPLTVWYYLWLARSGMAGEGKRPAVPRHRRPHTARSDARAIRRTQVQMGLLQHELSS
jgi:hypothetical protein